MKYTLTKKQKEELEKIGSLYRKTIYDPSIVTLPNMVKGTADGLEEIGGEISSSILSEVLRFHKLISSNYSAQMRERIDGLHKILSEQLSKDIFFYIVCRQKSWESVLRKILKYYFEGSSIILSDLVALRIIIDSNMPEKQQEATCHKISEICIKYFTKQHCTLMPPAKRVANNPLFKDYICFPKQNGYKSIHLAFMDIYNNIFEVQIRTEAMDANAEYGLNEIKTEQKSEEDVIQNNLDHLGYKDEEYEELLPYIFFDPSKVSKPFFRYYERINKKNEKEIKIIDRIGLMFAKPVEERARTF